MDATKRKGCLRTAGLLGCGGIIGIFALMVFVGIFVEKSETQTPASTRNLAVLMPTLTPTPAPPTATPIPTPTPTHTPQPGNADLAQYIADVSDWNGRVAVAMDIGDDPTAQDVFQLVVDLRRLRAELDTMHPVEPFLEVHASLIDTMDNCLIASEYAAGGDVDLATIYANRCAAGFRATAAQLETATNQYLSGR